MMVDCQPYAPAVFTPRKYSWYSFMLEAESTPGLQCDRKDFMSTNQRPTDLQHSTLTTVLPRSPDSGVPDTRTSLHALHIFRATQILFPYLLHCVRSSPGIRPPERPAETQLGLISRPIKLHSPTTLYAAVLKQTRRLFDFLVSYSKDLWAGQLIWQSY